MAIEKALDILISDELREILKPIETQSLVANLLLRGRHTDDILVDDPVNYISIGKQDKSKISYLSQDRIAALKEDDSPWTTTRRYMAKPGAFVAKIFKNIPSKEVENFSSLFQSLSNKKPMRFEVVKGEDIKEYYFYESYASNNGSLGASCMKHNHCQSYLSLYTDNSDMLSMVIMLNEEDRLMGRALLWDFDGNKIMDRIYTQNDEKLSFHFKQWATDNGYLYKSEQNWFNTLFFENISNEKKELRFDVKLPNYDHSRYPYMDTFKFFNAETGTFSNYLPEQRNVTILTASDGGQHGYDHLVFDDISRVYRYRNDAAFITYRNIWTSRQNAQYSNHNDTWILNEDAVYNDDLGDYIFNEANNAQNRPKIFELIEQRKKERERMNEKKARKHPAERYGYEVFEDTGWLRNVYYDTLQTISDMDATAPIAQDTDVAENDARTEYENHLQDITSISGSYEVIDTLDPTYLQRILSRGRRRDNHRVVERDRDNDEVTTN